MRASWILFLSEIIYILPITWQKVIRQVCQPKNISSEDYAKKMLFEAFEINARTVRKWTKAINQQVAKTEFANSTEPQQYSQRHSVRKQNEI